jgi:hypothetical protein
LFSSVSFSSCQHCPQMEKIGSDPVVAAMFLHLTAL